MHFRCLSSPCSSSSPFNGVQFSPHSTRIQPPTVRRSIAQSRDSIASSLILLFPSLPPALPRRALGTVPLASSALPHAHDSSTKASIKLLFWLSSFSIRAEAIGRSSERERGVASASRVLGVWRLDQIWAQAEGGSSRPAQAWAGLLCGCDRAPLLSIVHCPSSPPPLLPSRPSSSYY
ncbi:hypothetical protein Mapa_012458 [Marchantia paleacea]|nr:hypothetical protein Mapa_012458 [Marchantia paleacea]